MATVAELISDTESRMKKSVESLQQDLNTVRTGRASPAIVEHLTVDYYGAPTPLNQMASVSAPEARLLVIHPWDAQSIGNIEKAILKSDLGLTPSNDGTVLRLNIPTLTEERRRDMVRLVRKKVEEGRVAVRNVRRDTLEEMRSLEKNKEISQDEGKRSQEQLQKVTDVYIATMDSISETKEAEVTEV